MSRLSKFKPDFGLIGVFIFWFSWLIPLMLIHLISCAINDRINDLVIYIKVRFLGHKKIWVNDPFRDSFPIDVE